jgi:hypothetical protein
MKGRTGLYETQNCLGQSETLMLFFSKNEFKVRFIKKQNSCLILSRVSYSPTLPYASRKINQNSKIHAITDAIPF